MTEDGSWKEKEIYELEKEEGSKYSLIGQATGINMDHCVMLGSKHKDNFWHRVYGYRIIQDDEMARMMFDAMKNIKPDTEPYITVCFYERFADRKVMFVPSRLEISGRPELNNFPFNITFGTVTQDDNNTEREELSLYEPDLSTFTEEGFEQKMKYYNNLNPERRFWVEIAYNTNTKSYVGTKYRDDKSIGSAEGPSWDGFFVHLTLLGVGVALDVSN